MLAGIGAIALALHLGAMAFFAAGVAPIVFTRLPAEHAGRFIRALFPVYYLWVGATAAAAAVAILPLRPVDAAVLAVSAGVTAWLRQGLMPRINRLSDAAQAGDAAAKPRFDRAHRVSVVVNIAQMLAAIVLVARAG